MRFCDEAGFAVYDVLEGHMRSLDGALAQIDLAFIRKDSPLRSQSAYFSPEQLADYLDAAEQAARREELIARHIASGATSDLREQDEQAAALALVHHAAAMHAVAVEQARNCRSSRSR